MPGLSKAALDTLKAVQMAGLTTEIPRGGERYDARQRRKEEVVYVAWRDGRADPRVANERDGFMAAASERLGEEGMRDASRAASSGRSMTVPGFGREHQAGLDELARSFVRGRDVMAVSAAWDQRVERGVKETERQCVRAEERERRGLQPEPKQDRERHREGVGWERDEPSEPFSPCTLTRSVWLHWSVFPIADVRRMGCYENRTKRSSSDGKSA